MRYFLIVLAWVITIAPAIALGGCAQGSGPNRPQAYVESSRAKSYHSIHDLSADAQVIARVTATANHSVAHFGRGHVPYTTTTVRVNKILRGSASGSAIKIRQLGRVGGPIIGDDVPLLVAGNSYVVFLQRFAFGPGRDTDQYVIVGGGAGLFADHNGALKRLDPESPDLPSSIAFADLQKLIAH